MLSCLVSQHTLRRACVCVCENCTCVTTLFWDLCTRLLFDTLLLILVLLYQKQQISRATITVLRTPNTVLTSQQYPALYKASVTLVKCHYGEVVRRFCSRSSALLHVPTESPTFSISVKEMGNRLKILQLLFPSSNILLTLQYLAVGGQV